MKHAIIVLAVVALLAALVIASDVKLGGAKCVVTGEPVNQSVSADYKDGKIYFCCPSCIPTFKKDTAKYATKANHQLVLTGQAKQTSCPISGEPISMDKFVEVNGAKVYFCCDKCKNKVAKAGDDEQMNLAFGDAAWKKAGYKVGK